MPDVSRSLAAYSVCALRIGGHARLPQPETAPDQTDPGQKSAGQARRREISVAEHAIARPPSQGAEYRCRHDQHASQTTFNADEAGCRSAAQSGCNTVQLKRSENPAPSSLPQPARWPTALEARRTNGQAAKDSAGKADAASATRPPSSRHRL